jgi:hypothetical protein
MMTRHLADHRTPTTGARLKHFLRLAKAPRDSWHRSRDGAGHVRLAQFLRIARGRWA